MLLHTVPHLPQLGGPPCHLSKPTSCLSKLLCQFPESPGCRPLAEAHGPSLGGWMGGTPQVCSCLNAPAALSFLPVTLPRLCGQGMSLSPYHPAHSGAYYSGPPCPPPPADKDIPTGLAGDCSSARHLSPAVGGTEAMEGSCPRASGRCRVTPFSTSAWRAADTELQKASDPAQT